MPNSWSRWRRASWVVLEEGGERSPAVLDLPGRSQSDGGDPRARVDPGLEPHLHTLDEAVYQLEDLARVLRDYAGEIEFNPQRQVMGGGAPDPAAPPRASTVVTSRRSWPMRIAARESQRRSNSAMSESRRCSRTRQRRWRPAVSLPSSCPSGGVSSGALGCRDRA